MRDDRGPRTPVAEGTSSPPMTRRSARAAKKAHEGDGNVTPRRERARTAPEAASTAPTRARSTDRGTCAKRLDVIKEFASTTDEPASSPFKGFYKHLSLGLIQLCCDFRVSQSFHSSRLCVTQEESLGLYHFTTKVVLRVVDCRLARTLRTEL